MDVTVMSGVTETLFISLVRVISHNVSVLTQSKWIFSNNNISLTFTDLNGTASISCSY